MPTHIQEEAYTDVEPIPVLTVPQVQPASDAMV